MHRHRAQLEAGRWKQGADKEKRVEGVNTIFDI